VLYLPKILLCFSTLKLYMQVFQMVCGDRIGELGSCSSFGSSPFMKLLQVARRAECKHVGILFTREISVRCKGQVGLCQYLSRVTWYNNINKKGKAIPVTGRGGP
jgi:hypothetical protein